MTERFSCGYITTTHGIKGDVKVQVYDGDPGRLAGLKDVVLSNGKEEVKVEIAGAKTYKGGALVHFKGYDSINDVERFRNYELMIDRSQAQPLSEGEFYIADMIGASVYADISSELGDTSAQTSDLEDTSAPSIPGFTYFGTLKGVDISHPTPIFVIMHGEREILVPKAPDFYISADPEKHILKIHIIPGLL
ncbi:MAG: ribosome maturation factor RimM [Lachnospiraceae bacterium]|jgi:16S rRNA processing protein RimM|nr:ribosome maturation factor RimM [Lachnospiraceae bacterium]MEE3461310.1 ribosome maturation factor RimM [Lachnospiraceae bacterium]